LKPSTSRHDLHLVFEAIPSSRAPEDAASHEVFYNRPSLDTLTSVHSREGLMASASAPGCHTSRLVSPLRFPTASALYSSCELWRYCTPESKGVRYVSRASFSRLPCTPKRVRSVARDLPRFSRNAGTPQRVSLTDSRAASPRPMPSWSYVTWWASCCTRLHLVHHARVSPGRTSRPVENSTRAYGLIFRGFTGE
jgi:hypothetical protein